MEKYGEDAASIHIDRLVQLPGDILHKSFHHERGIGNDPRHVKGDQPPEAVGGFQLHRQLVLRYDQRRSGNDHRQHDEQKQEVPARKLKARDTESQSRRHARRDDHRGAGDEQAVQKIQVKFPLPQHIAVVFQGELLPGREKAWRKFVEGAVWLERGAHHVNHGKNDDDQPADQRQIQGGMNRIPFRQLHTAPS